MIVFTNLFFLFFLFFREFEAYMTEVKKLPGVLGQGRREIMEYFKQFIEDYNTATLPHNKFYNYERWEMEEYQRNKLLEQKKALSRSSAAAADLEDDVPLSFNDEAQRKTEQRRQKELDARREFNEIKMKMAANVNQREDMREQDRLKIQLQLAYKQGDLQTVNRLKQQLQPDDPRQTVKVKHPWA